MALPPISWQEMHKCLAISTSLCFQVDNFGFRSFQVLWMHIVVLENSYLQQRLCVFSVSSRCNIVIVDFSDAGWVAESGLGLSQHVAESIPSAHDMGQAENRRC